MIFPDFIEAMHKVGVFVFDWFCSVLFVRAQTPRKSTVKAQADLLGRPCWTLTDLIFPMHAHAGKRARQLTWASSIKVQSPGMWTLSSWPRYIPKTQLPTPSPWDWDFRGRAWGSKTLRPLPMQCTITHWDKGKELCAQSTALEGTACLSSSFPEKQLF